MIILKINCLKWLVNIPILGLYWQGFNARCCETQDVTTDDNVDFIFDENIVYSKPKVTLQFVLLNIFIPVSI